MLRIICFTTLVAVAMAMTTMMTPTGTVGTPSQILYDMKHHKAMIVMADGCYEYHMNHQDVQDAGDAATRATLEARMLAELAAITNKVETGHHHIDHMTQEIKTACVSVPVYSWDTAVPVGK